MKSYEYYLGIDVSKETLDVYVSKGKESVFHLCVSNDETGFKKLQSQLKKQAIPVQKTLVCLEDTGYYGYPFAFWAADNTYDLWMESPVAIKKSLGLVRGKNDKVDARRIALYAMRFQDECKLWQPPRQVLLKLKSLVALRTRLITGKRRFSVPLKEKAYSLAKKEELEVIACCNAALQGIEKSIKDTERKIDKLIRSDERLARMIKLITSIDGIGLQIATALIVATNEFQHVKNGRKLACYSGVVPFEHQSGTSVRGRSRVSHLANKTLKSLLYMGVLSAIQNSDELRAYYQRKVAEGKSKLSVINAIKNKQILRIYACIRDNRIYEKNYTLKLA